MSEVDLQVQRTTTQVFLFSVNDQLSRYQLQSRCNLLSKAQLSISRVPESNKAHHGTGICTVCFLSDHRAHYTFPFPSTNKSKRACNEFFDIKEAWRSSETALHGVYFHSRYHSCNAKCLQRCSGDRVLLMASISEVDAQISKDLLKAERSILLKANERLSEVRNLL